MTTQAYILGVLNDGNSESQVLIPCVANKNLRALASDELPAFDTVQSMLNQVQDIVTSGSPVSVSNGTPANIASVDLEAGTWDIYFLLGVQGILEGTTMSGSISEASATNGTLGDNMIQVGLLNLSSSQMLLVPSYRITTTELTTVYGVAEVNFTLGTPSCFGKLVAKQVI